MTSNIRNLMCLLLILAIAPIAAAGDAIELRLSDGTRWRGTTDDRVELTVRDRHVEQKWVGQIVEVHDRYIIAEVMFGTQLSKRPFMLADIISIRVLPKEEVRDTDRPTERRPDRTPVAADRDRPGIFFFPMYGAIGYFDRGDSRQSLIRAEELRQMKEYLDKNHGPGQIVVLHMDTPGGAVVETEEISKILFEMRRDHRLIAWVREAISGGCYIIIHCHEIYFTSEGSAGAMTPHAGGNPVPPAELRRYLAEGGRLMEAGGRSPYIAHAMIQASSMLSYDKDPETGEVTFYNDLSGEYILSNDKDNLVLTASQAVHCGFAQGIANSLDDLAKLLDLDEWYETSNYGRRIHGELSRNLRRAADEIPLLLGRLEYRGTHTGDRERVLRTRISIWQQLLAWWRRCPPAAEVMLPPEQYIERQIEELQRELRLLRQQR